MSEAKWTPLSVSYATMQTFKGSETDERYFALNTEGWSEFGTIVNLRSTGKPNPLGRLYANRIASCWNACLSIPDPEKAIPALQLAAKALRAMFEAGMVPDRDSFPEKTLTAVGSASNLGHDAMAALALSGVNGVRP